jgi:cytochrome o ubiquinol oxidase subunit 2
MRKIFRIVAVLVALAGLAGIVFFLLNGADFAVLNPRGEIADKQKQLIIIAVLLGLIVILPVFVMLFLFAWRYREGNTKAKYAPDWQNNRFIETLWWGIPFVIIFVLGIVAWQSSHELDPYKPLESDKKPVKIQVVALQWRWLFMYPEEGVASINEVRFPVDTPVNFEITADAPMNSFWIPKLGGQVYAMTGMSTKLHLQADEKGSYEGSSANISGKGFAGMRFTANVMSNEEFNHWVSDAKRSPNDLNSATYAQMAEPSEDRTPKSYVLREPCLYDTIVMKYMGSH